MKPLLLCATAGLLITGCASPTVISTPKLDILDKQVQANPSNAQAYSNRGYTRALLGQRAGARSDLHMAVTLKSNGPMHNGAGWAYFNLGDYADALREWKTAAELSQGKAHYDDYSLALGYWGVGKIQLALENYQRAVEREPKFGAIKTLQERIVEWSPRERRAMEQMYVLWSKAYRP